MPRGTISEREPAGGGLLRVRIALDRETAATHTRHGQYIEISHEPGGDAIAAPARGYFAIASAPGELTWDILARDGGTMGERLHTLPVGDRLMLSEAMGPGFPVEQATGHPLIIAVTGSGIAAALSTLGARIEAGEARKTFLLYGVRDRSELALLAELDAMRAAGVDVAVCLSRQHVAEPGFYKGYVQDVAKERGWRLSHGLIFAAGHEAMIEGMREAARALGLSSDDVRVNA